MFEPEPPSQVPGRFEEPWQAETLALADAMIRAGHFSAADWAAALNHALAAASGAPDTPETYFRAALSALEALILRHTALDADALAARRAAWERAYRNTPHGQPVTL